MNPRTRQLIFEFISIVFAVTLALTLNEWRQSRKIEKLVDRVLQTLKDETNQNLENIRYSIEYRDNLVNELLSNTHVIVSFSRDEVPFNIENDKEFETFMRGAVIETVGQYVENVEVIRLGDQRFLRTEDQISTIRIQNDSVIIYGKSNIQLRTAGISSNTWGLAQATNALIDMDYDLVMVLGQANDIYSNYISISEKAINILYTGDGEIVPVLQDMLFMERQLESKYEEILHLLQ